MLLPALFISIASAQSDEEFVEDPAPRARPWPIRVLTGPAVRNNTAAGPFFELGFRAAGDRRIHLDLGLNVTPPRIFTLPGPRRFHVSVDAIADLVFDIGPYLSTGPTAGISYRLFGQRFNLIQGTPMGVFGWMAGITLFRGRNVGMMMNARIVVDSRPVDLILATSQIQRMPITEGRLGFGMTFGRRKTP
ncbi:MAG: hypothetical protein AAGA48_27800 [Myxococcota bacterium]